LKKAPPPRGGSAKGKHTADTLGGAPRGRGDGGGGDVPLREAGPEGGGHVCHRGAGGPASHHTQPQAPAPAADDRFGPVVSLRGADNGGKKTKRAELKLIRG